MKTYKYYLTKAPLGKRVFIFVLTGIGFIGVISIIFNTLMGYSQVINIKWVVTMAVSVLLIKIYTEEYFQYLIELITFIVLIFIMIPIGYYDVNGDIVVSMAYMFAIITAINLVFKKIDRIILAGVTLLIFIILFVLDLGDLAFKVDWNRETFERLINIPLTVFAASWGIGFMARSYRLEHKMLVKKNDELIRANIQLEATSNIDFMTDIYNRRFMYDDLKKMVDAINLGSNNHLSILVIDIDDFKKINDTYGHYIGDSIIKSVALMLRQTFENSCHTVGRHGGDEFLIGFKDCDIKDVKKCIEKIRKQVKQLQLPHNIQITVSGGLASYRLDRHRTIDNLMMEADKRLFIAKQSGKDMIISM